MSLLQQGIVLLGNICNQSTLHVKINTMVPYGFAYTVVMY